MSRDRIIQLQECAEELGFSTIQEALDAGYHEVQDLVAGTFKLEKIDDLMEQEKAHEAWLEEKEEVLRGLEEVKEDIINMTGNNKHLDVELIIDAIDFIEKGEC